MTIKDFDHFVNHERSFDERVDRLTGKMLFTLQDEKWKQMRSTLSPLFTSSKMKMMFGMLSKSATEFIEHHEKTLKRDGKLIVDCKDIYSRFTVDGISTTALGFEGDCVKNEKSELFDFTMRMMKPKPFDTLKILIFMFFRWLYYLLKLQLTTKEVYDFFYNAIVKVMKEREEKGIFRSDLIQLLIQAQKGQLNAECDVNEKEQANFSANIEYEVNAKNKKGFKWTDEELMAQGFIFFGAGFDTTRSLLEIASYLLAKNKDIQEELIAEIDDVISELDGS
jgi:cytochrome P450 family 9